MTNEQLVTTTGPLLAAMLNSSPISHLACESVQNGQGEIIDFRLVFVNTAAANGLGQRTEAVLNHSISEFAPLNRYAFWWNHWLTVVESGISQTYSSIPSFLAEYPFFSQVAIEPWQNGFFMTYQLDEKQTANQPQVVTHSSAPEAQTSPKLLNNAEQLQAIMNISQTGMFLFKPIYNAQNELIDFAFTLANQVLATYVGQDAQTLIGDLGSRWFPAYKTNGLFDAYRRSYEENQVQRFEFHYNDDGINSWLDILSARFGDQCLVTFLDITPLKTAIFQVEQTVNTLENVLNSTPTGILVLKAIRDDQQQISDFKIETVNQTATESMAMNGRLLKGERLGAIFPNYANLGLLDFYAEVVNTGKLQRREVHLVDDQLNAWYDITAVKQHDGVVISYLNITQAKQTQYQLEATIHQLENSNENLEQFAYIASHDLQEPLRKLQAFGDVLENQFADSLAEGEKDLVRRIRNSAKRMQLLVKDLLTYSRLATQTEPFTFVSLNRILEDVLSDLELTIAEKKAVIHLTDLPSVQGIPFRLRQLFQNLLSNAIKFNQPHTRPEIHIRVRTTQPNELPDVLQVKPKPYLLIEVQDNGIGFDEKYKNRIFQPFQRLHGQSTYGGTGIGLAVCKKVAESHGGTIDVASQLGVGSTFKIYLPLFTPNQVLASEA
ncbi:sensor histidine kinase [Tellurirhabdus bombi]|uniref:sensor histidine kinase n=1 Tax=Tellurirhabdus bombi TaxID=2907205 RepID=UPI001F17A10F|nr:ATP-binding protein [Tellurirhabdus bombi]